MTKHATEWAFRELDPTQLLPGDILHVRGYSLFPSRAIRRALGGKVWGNHDALVIPYNGRLRIGETAPPFSRLVEIEEYNRGIREGRFEVRVFRLAMSPEQAERACEWWINNVQGRLYDFAAYPRLIAKCIVGDLFHGAPGWKWANWCTEGVIDALNHGIGGRLLETRAPTPLHVERLVNSGALVDVARGRL